MISKKKKFRPPLNVVEIFFCPPNFADFFFAAILFASFALFFVNLPSLAPPIYSNIDYCIGLIYSSQSSISIWHMDMDEMYGANQFYSIFVAILFASFFVHLHPLAPPIYSNLTMIISNYWYVFLIHLNLIYGWYVWGEPVFALRMRYAGQASWITLLDLLYHPLPRLFYPLITTNMTRLTYFFKYCTPINR